MSGPLVTAVVVTFQSERSIGSSLASLRRSYERGLLNCIVVDNVSRDRTLEIVKCDHPWARLMETGANIGYGRALNVGLAETSTPYVMFMNPDATIEPEAVIRLVEFAESKPRVGMVAPAIIEGEHYQMAGRLASPRTILGQASGLAFSSMRQRPILPGQAPFQTDWLCGALMLMRTTLAREMGGFDDRIFLYFEETDLCRRLLQRGLELWAVGEAIAHHEGGASASQEREGLVDGCLPEHYFRSRYYYIKKHWGGLVAAFTEVGDWALVSMRWLARRLRGRDAGDLRARLRRPVMRMPAMPRGSP